MNCGLFQLLDLPLEAVQRDVLKYEPNVFEKRHQKKSKLISCFRKALFWISRKDQAQF